MKYLKLIAVIFILSFFTGCKKYLDLKPDKKLVVPSSLTDLQAILDYYPNLTSGDPSAEEVSSDNYYLTDADWSSLSLESQRRIYTWQPDNLFEVGFNDWGTAYRRVFYANTVLDNLQAIPINTVNKTEWNNIKGQALFTRAKSFMQVANIWCLAYDPTSAATDLGIPLRMHADLTESSVRVSLQQTYQQIITDLRLAATLLPNIPLHVTRASKPAAFACLSRTYLAMQQFSLAGLYADSCLQLSNTLIDYNSISTTATYPFSRFNAEVIFHSTGSAPQLARSRCKIDSALYNAYDINDCRRSLYFLTNTDGSVAFKGSYDGSNGGLFTGIATDELYLTRAECYARAGNTAAALADLNTLMIKRIKTANFTPVTASGPQDALNKILVERRKELLMRFSRWMDIKRLNKLGAGIALKRKINNSIYELPANDLRYALPVPEDIIRITSMPQNPR